MLHLLYVPNSKNCTSCLADEAPVTKLGLANTMMAIAEDACSMEGTAADNPCRAYGSWIRAPRWSSAVAAADAVASSETGMPPLLDQKASSCRSTCAYRSSARGRLLSSAASTRFGPNDQVERRERSALARFSNSLECTDHGNSFAFLLISKEAM